MKDSMSRVRKFFFLFEFSHYYGLSVTPLSRRSNTGCFGVPTINNHLITPGPGLDSRVRSDKSPWVSVYVYLISDTLGLNNGPVAKNLILYGESIYLGVLVT